MTYQARDIAEYIIYREASQGRTVSNLRLQKLLYFVQAQFIVQKDVPCFTERMEAWDYGPVVPEVYRAYKFYGSNAIPYTKTSFRHIDDADKVLIDSMLDSCSDYSTSTLVDMTHSQNPWKFAYQNPLDNEITISSMYHYFKES